MAKFSFPKGALNRNIPLLIWNSGTNQPFSGLVFNTTNLSGEYRREYQTSWVPISLAAGSVGVYTSGGLVADGNQAGRYQFGLPNEIFATGNDRFALFSLYNVANMVPVNCELELYEANFFDRNSLGVTSISGAVQRTEAISVTVSGYATNNDPGFYVLQNTNNKLKTNSLGEVVVSGGKVAATLNTGDITGALNVIVTGYNSVSLPSTFILTHPNNKINTTSDGSVVISGGTLTAAVTGQLNVLVTGYTTTASPNNFVFTHPTHRLLTDVNGYTVLSGKPNVSLLTSDISGPLTAQVTGYTSGFDPGSYILLTPSQKLKTSAYGHVQLDFNQLIGTTHIHGSMGETMYATLSANFGKWVINTGVSPPTFDIYAVDDTTIARTFTLDSLSAPTSRT